MRQYMKKKRIDDTELSILVRDVNADAPLLAFGENTPRNPASTMKVVTTWSAIKTLGPSWTWDTEAWLRGRLDGDTLYGDLVLKGYGDPFLVYETFWQFVHELRLKGLRTITGDLIIDNSFFEVPDIDPGAFDNQPSRVYNAPPAALMFNFNATRFLFTPSPQSGRVDVIAQPALNALVIDNQLELSDGRCLKQHYNPIILDPVDGRMVIKGQYAADCGQRELLRLVSKPDQHVYDAFRENWLQLGGEIQGKMRSGVVQSGDERFYVHSSRPLAEQVRLINKWSNNVMTRQLLLSTGAKRYEAPGTLVKGRLAVLDVLAEQQVKADSLVLDNGSGLSREARISASELGQLLFAIWHDPYMPELLNSLPLVGEDGTMARRFRRTDLAGRSRLKTGTLQNVTALAGYMLTRTGKRMIIVMLHNGKKAGSHGRELQNQLLEWVFEQ